MQNKNKKFTKKIKKNKNRVFFHPVLKLVLFQSIILII